MLVDPATTPQRATRGALKTPSPLNEAIHRRASKKPSPLNETARAAVDAADERALPRGGRSREVAVRSDWRHFDTEIEISPQTVDAELWELLPEVKPHKGKPFVWRFVPSPSGQVKMYILIKLSSCEMLKLRVGNGKASQMMASQLDDDEEEALARAPELPQVDTPTRMRRAAKEQALARIGALRSAREARPSLVWDAAWAAQQGTRRLAAAKQQQKVQQQEDKDEEPAPQQQQQEQQLQQQQEPQAAGGASRRRPSLRPREHEPMNGTTGMFVPVDVERWRETTVATFLDHTMLRQEAEEAASRVGIHMPGAGSSESKVAGWGAIRFGRRKGEKQRDPTAATASELHDPAAGPIPVLPPRPPLTPRDTRMLTSAI
jgi:hypothetical protein